MKKTFRSGVWKAAFSTTVPVMAGYLVLGAAFGILLADKGYSFWWAALMSVFIYAGSMQFVTVNLLTGGASLVSAALMTLLVNARHLLYGVSMLEKYRSTGRAKPYLIFSLTDETYALLCGKDPEAAKNQKSTYYLLVSILNQLYWVVGCTAGGLLGGVLHINTAGIDFAMTALFTVIFTEQLLSFRDYAAGAIGVGCTAGCLLVFGSEGFLIPAMALIVLLLLVRSVLQERRAHHD